MLNIGTRFGPYEIESALGAGGMGEVYRARDTRLDRTVAIKVLPSHLSLNAELKQRFEREAKVISQLNHPNICTLYDVGHDSASDTDYLVMEFLDGETLAERLRTGLIPPDQVVKIGCEIADALEKAHRAGIVHRDLKPGNVILTKTGAKLLDFGLAKPASMSAVSTSGSAPLLSAAMTVTSPNPQASPLTSAGVLVGTIQYMSPEQLQGIEADARSDIFSFGSVLYEMTTGKRAFEGKSAISVASSILEREPEPITARAPLTPPALAHVINTCLAKDPEERFQTAHDVKVQLKWIAEVGSAAVGLPTVKSVQRRRREWLAWGMAALLAIVGVAVGWWLHAPIPPEVLRSNLELPANEQVAGVDSSLAFSPDGRKLALTLTGSDGNSKIWIRSLDSLTTNALTGTEGGTYPTWSPDGRFLAFFADHKLKKIDVAGSTVQTLCDADDGRGIAWGRNGTLVFAPGPFTGLFTVSSAGGSPSELTHPAASGETHRLPQLLPDDEHVLFFSGSLSGKANAILVLSLKTRQTTEVLKPAESGPRYVAPGYLVFLKEQNLMAQPFDVKRLKLTGEAVPIAEQVQYTNFRWTGGYTISDTGLLAYRRQGTAGVYQLTWMDMDGKELGKVGEPISVAGITLSPDAKHAILMRPETGGHGSIKLWIYDLQNGVMSRFTFSNGDDQSPVWSPDGKQVVYSANRGQGFGIYVKAASGSSSEQLLYRADDLILPTSWSPDGKLLAFDSVGGQNKNGALWILPMTGEQKPYRLHPTTENNERTGFFSHDGKWFCYESDESGRNEVYVVPFPGPGGKWQITQGGGTGRWLGSDQILWVTAEQRAMATSVKAKGADLEIGSARPLFGGKPLPQTAGADFTQDGKRILTGLQVVEHAANPSLILVDHWTAELRK
ncbi:MAG: protein kinase [Acidobacteriia bacterium]|nr:protein kinase [Terriglobia bacterium]